MVALHIPTVALVGNPNTGKTTLFNALAGMNQRVGNYPGVTVETKKGKLRHGELTFDLIDLPGTYSLAPRSPDEMVAVDLILGNASEPRPDVVVTDRSMRRTWSATPLPDDAGPRARRAGNRGPQHDGRGRRHKGLKVDIDKLSQQLGVPVVALQANKSKGLDQLKAALARSLDPKASVVGPVFPQAFESEVGLLRTFTNDQEPTFLLQRLLL